MEKAFHTRADLKKMGWTDGAIAKFLGKPDLIKDNPHYKKAAPMSLYSIERVDSVMQSEEFKQWQEATLERRKSASDRMKAIAQEKQHAKALKGWGNRFADELQWVRFQISDLESWARETPQNIELGQRLVNRLRRKIADCRGLLREYDDRFQTVKPRAGDMVLGGAPLPDERSVVLGGDR